MRGSILKLSDLAMDIVGDDPLVSAALRWLIRSTGVTNFETFNLSGESSGPARTRSLELVVRGVLNKQIPAAFGTLCSRQHPADGLGAGHSGHDGIGLEQEFEIG